MMNKNNLKLPKIKNNDVCSSIFFMYTRLKHLFIYYFITTLVSICKLFSIHFTSVNFKQGRV